MYVWNYVMLICFPVYLWEKRIVYTTASLVVMSYISDEKRISYITTEHVVWIITVSYFSLPSAEI